MFRCWIVVVLAAALCAGRADAAELTGFGPIKFGMTKEQAKAALEAAGLKAKFEQPNWLEYDYPNNRPLGLEGEWESFKVVQLFENGLARNTKVELRWRELYPGVCFFYGIDFVSAVLSKYDHPRVVKEEIANTFWTHGREVTARIYLVPFNNDAFIKVVLMDDVRDYEFSQCRFWALYQAPGSNPTPF